MPARHAGGPELSQLWQFVESLLCRGICPDGMDVQFAQRASEAGDWASLHSSSSSMASLFLVGGKKGM